MSYVSFLPFQTECDFAQLCTISNQGPSVCCTCTSLSSMDLEDDQTDSGVCCVSLASISKLGDVLIDSNLETMLPNVPILHIWSFVPSRELKKGDIFRCPCWTPEEWTTMPACLQLQFYPPRILLENPLSHGTNVKGTVSMIFAKVTKLGTFHCDPWLKINRILSNWDIFDHLPEI